MRVSREQAAANRKRVVEVAGAMFREKGFDGVGLAEIMKGAGLTHGGFYGQFSSKDGLAAEAMANALEASAGRWRARVATSPDAARDAITRHYLSSTHRDGVAAGCPLAALTGDVVRQPEAVRHSLTEGVQVLVDILAETLVDVPEPQRRQEALAIMAQMMGAMMLARAVDDVALSDEILAAARSAVGLTPAD